MSDTNKFDICRISTHVDGHIAKKAGASRELGRPPDQLKNLVFTHGQPDHIGSAAAIAREIRARTYMHPLDIPMAESGGPFRPMKPAPSAPRRHR